MTYIVEHIRNEFKRAFERTFPPDHSWHARRLRATDGPYALGMRVATWSHDPATAQIGQVEPGLGYYSVQLQNLVKHMDEEQALRIFDVQCALMRSVLYRDTDLRVRLLGVAEEVSGSSERTKRLFVVRQDFLDNKVSSQFMYLCSTEVRIETEITQLG